MTMPLSAEDLKHLTAAQGFTELGMWLDANAELEKIDPEVRHVPEVLEVRVQIYRALEKWELMQTVAKKLTEADPAVGFGLAVGSMGVAQTFGLNQIVLRIGFGGRPRVEL